MSKFKKEPKQTLKTKKKITSDEEFAFKSVFITAILSGFFILLSLFLNGFNMLSGLIESHEIHMEIIYALINSSVIILFFFFSLISIGNYKDLTGKPVDWREIVLLIGLSLIQTIRNPLVFIFTLIGLILIVIYMYLVQEG